MLAIDSRHNTWDGVDSPFGPDVAAVAAALRFAFERVAIDPTKIALGCLSDGGFYALSLGIANGDLFTHLVAVAPGFYEPPAPPVGRPRIFLAHGMPDNVQRGRKPGAHRSPAEGCRLRGDVFRVRRPALGDRRGGAPHPGVAGPLTSRVRAATVCRMGAPADIV
jgi:hypothetical protein